MKQIKLVEIFECGLLTTTTLDVCPETFDYIAYLVNTHKYSQLNIVII